jgi:hypothetical protein
VGAVDWHVARMVGMAVCCVCNAAMNLRLALVGVSLRLRWQEMILGDGKELDGDVTGLGLRC